MTKARIPWNDSAHFLHPFQSQISPGYEQTKMLMNQLQPEVTQLTSAFRLWQKESEHLSEKKVSHLSTENISGDIAFYFINALSQIFTASLSYRNSVCTWGISWSQIPSIWREQSVLFIFHTMWGTTSHSSALLVSLSKTWARLVVRKNHLTALWASFSGEHLFANHQHTRKKMQDCLLLVFSMILGLLCEYLYIYL